MNIVMIGGGKVGEMLCQELALEQNNVVLIETNEERLNRIISKCDITGLVGDGGDYDVLVEAGVEHCDVFIAATAEDETNIISSIIAKRLGAQYTIARVRNPKYTHHIEFVRESLGINLVINPEMVAARFIAKSIEFPHSLSIQQFGKGRVSMVELEIKSGSPLANQSLAQFRRDYGDVLICALTHDKVTVIPSGQTTLKVGDHLFVTGAREDLANFYAKAGYRNEKIRTVLIIGGGRATYYTLKLLTKMDLAIKVIELNEERATRLSYEFPDVVVIKGDGMDQELLMEERIESFDVVLSMTGIDEENIINSMYALSLGIKKVMTKVSRTGLLQILKDSDLQSIVTPKRLITSKILRYIRSLKNATASNVEALIRIANDEVETLQFLVKDTSRVLNVKLKDLNTKDNTLIAYILRGEQLIYPSGEDAIQAGDRVLIVTKHMAFSDIDDILE